MNDFMPILSQFLSILNNVSQLRLGRHPLKSLYSDSTKHEKLFDKKMAVKNSKIKKRSHAYKGYVSTDNVDILNAFNAELQLKNTEPAIKTKLKDSLSKLRGFKFMTTVIIELNKKTESDEATKYRIIYSNSKG